jgi:tetratricopeptide (TPR) repeat protein
MYALLIKADLVIADISTANPNAIYELGIRHAVKPYATIIIKEDAGKIPFDLDHARIFQYKHLGEDLGADEAKNSQDKLIKLIESVTKESLTDSPMYEYINIDPPTISEDEYKKIIGELAEQEHHIFAITEKAKDKMDTEDFVEASNLWRKASELFPNEPFFMQQHALCRYKSKSPTESIALTDALTIIHKLDINGDTNDPETLGIAGAINRRLFQLNGEIEYLNRAIELYGKGFKVRSDYYNGENYAFCLNLKAYSEKNKDEQIYLKIEAKKTREKIINNLQSIPSEDLKGRSDEKWIYASMSTCYLALGNEKKSLHYKELFMSEDPKSWEMETFESSRKTLMQLIGR